ncbi:MAG: cysteine--tRNA ligase [Gammaproteobacteria bacterium]|nr:cysteine--tRNA ligase [Gammaproteobacteria bacterium]
MLKIYNNLTNKKEIFIPIEPGKIRMYVCGITVYDYCHIGHSRAYIVFDMVARFLRHLGYDVTYIRNITDIDDKIIQRANENGEDFHQLTTRFIKAMHEDFDQLNILMPDLEPKATDHIPAILTMIETLIDKGFAYQAENGDVYFAVNEFNKYGELSGKRVEDLRAGERVDVDTNKRDPMDFVLWKMAKENEPFWESNYGKGRPGWHIECSAMSTEMLGNHFDIHGGGQDLQFPHHENEIAQSECCTGEKFVNYWMHNGFVRVNEEKMSKSLGNFFTIRDVLKEYRAEEIRFFILSSHYRSQINYSDEQLDQARSGLERLYAALLDVEFGDVPKDTEYQQRFELAMNDDFNTAEAIAVLFDLTRDVNRAKAENSPEVAALGSLLKYLANLLGLLELNAAEFLKSSVTDDGLSNADIDLKVEQRQQAKKDKNWAMADQIRDELTAAGIVLEDNVDGTRWRR